MSNLNTAPISLLREETTKLGLGLSDSQLGQFIKFMDMLLEWNKKINLTTIIEEKEIIIKHFIDSLLSLRYINEIEEKPNSLNLIDIGTGAGFPGIPLKIAKPDISLTLLDATKKKVGFLNEVVKELEFKNVKCLHARAEEAGRLADMREKYDAAVSRAVAPLVILAEYCLPFVKVNGRFIALKGQDLENEIMEASGIINILGGEAADVIKINTLNMNRTIIVLNKKKDTPMEYPRKNKKIKPRQSCKAKV